MDTPRTPTILVVEDDPAISTLAREALTDEGYRVAAAATAEEARQVLAACRFRLVLSDTVGAASPADPAFWGGLEAIRDAARGTPVVIFSAHDPSIFAGYDGRGFAGLLPKPFDLDDLVGTVERLAGPSHSED